MTGFLKRRPGLAVAFAVAVLVTTLFALRLIVSIAIWSDPARIDQPVADWMTPRYVARSWDVPPAVLAEALDLPMSGTGRRTTLEEIALRDGREPAEIIADVESAIAAWRERSGD